MSPLRSDGVDGAFAPPSSNIRYDGDYVQITIRLPLIWVRHRNGVAVVNEHRDSGVVWKSQSGGEGLFGNHASDPEI